MHLRSPVGLLELGPRAFSGVDASAQARAKKKPSAAVEEIFPPETWPGRPLTALRSPLAADWVARDQPRFAAACAIRSVA